MKFTYVFFACAIACTANLSAGDLPVERALSPYFEAAFDNLQQNPANLNQPAVEAQAHGAVAAPEAIQAENDDVDMEIPNQENNHDNQDDAEAPLFLVLPNNFLYHTPVNQVNAEIPVLFGEDDLVMVINDLNMDDAE